MGYNMAVDFQVVFNAPNTSSALVRVPGAVRLGQRFRSNQRCPHSNGYLPIIAEGEAEYLPKLEQVINAIVDTDLAYIASYNAGTAVKVKRLLGVIAESAPFKPNMSALARKMKINRESLYEYVYQLRDARLLNILSAEGKGVSRLQKPDKIFLENTNLAYAIDTHPDKGNIRETFLLNQLMNTGIDVTSPL
jgi:predicted AAA+ superfamily ATPase